MFRRFLAVATVLALAGWITAVTAGANPTAHRVRPLTLQGVNARCFFAPSAIGRRWPLVPRLRPHTIRGGFNDLRGTTGSHWGVDVAAGVERQAVFAVKSGRISGISRSGGFMDHFWIAGIAGYWHVHLAPWLHSGSWINAGQYVGRVIPKVNHVHFAELTPGCGYVDPRRPTGPFHDPANTEKPQIGEPSAFVAGPAAYRVYNFQLSPERQSDASQAIRLDNLHGVVDLRSSVVDIPVHRMTRFPQPPLMPAAVQAYIAPPNKPSTRLGLPVTFDGSRQLRGSAVYRVMAPGSVRYVRCFGGGGPCITRLIFHVMGYGLDTRRFHDGNYLLCVRAVTINNHANRRCTPVTINNQA
jgi:hypothetical protein